MGLRAWAMARSNIRPHSPPITPHCAHAPGLYGARLDLGRTPDDHTSLIKSGPTNGNPLTRSERCYEVRFVAPSRMR